MEKLKKEIKAIINDNLSNLNKDTIEQFEYLTYFMKEC